MSAVRPLSEADVVAAFGDALSDAGFCLKGAPVMDGAWHRAAVQGDKGAKTSGRYKGYLNGVRPAGFIRHFKDPTRTGTWKYGGDLPRVSQAEREAQERERAAAQAATEHDKTRRLDATAEESTKTWTNAKPALPGHAYLADKGIPPDGLRVDGRNRLLVPMYDVGGRLRSLQTIGPDGRKLFPLGSQIHGLHLLLGEVRPGGVLLIAEGYATGQTLFDAQVSSAVAVGFDKGNFVGIARHYGERFPGLRVGFAGDNDHCHPRRNPPLSNVGKDAAETAAREVVGSAAILPHFEPHEDASDWNDFAALHGLHAVRAAIEAALPPPPLPLKPHYPAPRHTREGANTDTKAVIRQFGVDAARWAEINRAWKRKLEEIEKHAPVGSSDRRNALKRARAEMAAEHGADWKTPGARVLMVSPAGMGKTSAFSDTFSDVKPSLSRIGYLSNLRKNYVDVASKTSGATVVHGRLAPDPEAPPGTLMCLRPRAAEALMKAGLQVAETLCAQDGAKCAHIDECGYQREQRRIAEGGFNIFCGAHEHLTTPAKAMRNLDAVVVDERFIEKLAGHLSFGLDRLLPTTMDNYQRAGLPQAMEFRRLMQLVKEAVVDPAGNLAGLRARGITHRKHLQPAIAYISKVEANTALDGVGPRTRDDVLIEKVERYQKTELSLVRKMLIALQKELHLPRDHAHGVAFLADELKEVDGAKERQSRVHVFYKKELAFSAKVPVLAMDASGDATLLRRVLGDRLRSVELRCERNVFVTKVVDTALARSTLMGTSKRGKELGDASEAKAERKQEQIAAIVNGLAARHGGDFFFVTNKPVKEAMEPRLDPSALAGHFGGVRGSNAFEHCVAGGNAGREQIPPLGAEAIARALFADDPEPLLLTGKYIKTTRGVRMRDGSAVPIEVWVHPDPRVQAVVELFRERELEQDLDRLRVVHNTEAKHWYDICNVPTDVTVDRLITYKQLLHEATGRMDNGRQGEGRRFYVSRLKEAVRRGNGVLPLSAAELVRLHGGEGGLWGSETAAKRDLEKGHTRQIDVFTECAPFPPVEVAYRRPGQRGRACRALVAAPRHDRDAIRAKLEAVVGEIASLEIAPLDARDADPVPKPRPERVPVLPVPEPSPPDAPPPTQATMPDPTFLPELAGLAPTWLGLRPVAACGIDLPDLFTPEDLLAIRRPGRLPLQVERDGRGAVHIEPTELWPIAVGVVSAGLEAWLRFTPPRLGGAPPCEARA